MEQNRDQLKTNVRYNIITNNLFAFMLAMHNRHCIFVLTVFTLKVIPCVKLGFTKLLGIGLEIMYKVNTPSKKSLMLFYVDIFACWQLYMVKITA